MADIDTTTDIGIQNFTVYAGDTFTTVFKFFSDDAVPPVVPQNLTGWAFALEVRKPGTSGTAKIRLTTANSGGLTIGGADSNELTAITNVGIKGGAYSWDIEATKPDGTVKTYVKGTITVVQDITNSSSEK